MITQKTSNYAEKFQKGEPVGFLLYYLSKEKDIFVSSLLKKILAREGKAYLHDTVITVLKELLINAVKANSKRYYFLNNKYDITDTKDYSTGMESFKSYITTEKEKIEPKLRDSNLKVEFYIKKQNDNIKIYIRNNTPLLPEEEKRINERIEQSKKYNDFSEIYEQLADDLEGEGLGLLLTMLFLRNSGIGENALTFASNDKLTQTVLTIPHSIKPLSVRNKISKRILDEVEDLPSFPDHVNYLLELCADHDAPMSEITDGVAVDPALSSAVLKLANSAGFISRQKVDTIDSAVKKIGIKNLSAILTASSAKSILDNRYSLYQKIWSHSNKVAFYAKEIGMLTGRSRILDQLYLGGMLHDLGKIVLLASTDVLGEWIENISDNRAMQSSTVLEEISVGLSHAEIGAQIAKKWKLPDYVHESIQRHHQPLSARPAHMDVVFIIYLANELCKIDEGRQNYFYLENDILKLFKLDDQTKFNNFHNTIRSKIVDIF